MTEQEGCTTAGVRKPIRQTLALTRGNEVQAARLLGIASSTLDEKLKRHGL